MLSSSSSSGANEPSSSFFSALLSFFLCHSTHSRTQRYHPLLIGGMFSQTYIDITSMTNNLPLSLIYFYVVSPSNVQLCATGRENHLHNLIVIVSPMYRLSWASLSPSSLLSLLYLLAVSPSVTEKKTLAYSSTRLQRKRFLPSSFPVVCVSHTQRH